MTTPINNANAGKQLKYDTANAANDVKEINYVKQQAAAAPDHKVTKDQASRLTQALQNLQQNQSQVQTDLQGLQATGHTADVAHGADYMNALNNLAQQGVQGLESNNDLDSALTASGSSAGQLHDLATQVNTANAGNLNYANSIGSVDSNNAGAVQKATTDSTLAPGTTKDPYTSGHNAAPSGVADLTQSSNSQGAGGVANATASTVISGVKAGNTAQATQDLKSGYANYLAVSKQTDSPALQKQFGESVKSSAASAPGISDDNKTTVGGLVDSWVAGK